MKYPILVKYDVNYVIEDEWNDTIYERNTWDTNLYNRYIDTQHHIHLEDDEKQNCVVRTDYAVYNVSDDLDLFVVIDYVYDNTLPQKEEFRIYISYEFGDSAENYTEGDLLNHGYGFVTSEFTGDDILNSNPKLKEYLEERCEELVKKLKECVKYIKTNILNK